MFANRYAAKFVAMRPSGNIESEIVKDQHLHADSVSRFAAASSISNFKLRSLIWKLSGDVWQQPRTLQPASGQTLGLAFASFFNFLPIQFWHHDFNSKLFATLCAMELVASSNCELEFQRASLMELWDPIPLEVDAINILCVWTSPSRSGPPISRWVY